MGKANVVIMEEVKKGKEGDWILCFQYCTYQYSDGAEEKGYRFIWRNTEGKLQPVRGQARIPSVADILELTSQAINEGWGHYNCNK